MYRRRYEGAPHDNLPQVKANGDVIHSAEREEPAATFREKRIKKPTKKEDRDVLRFQ